MNNRLKSVVIGLGAGVICMGLGIALALSLRSQNAPAPAGVEGLLWPNPKSVAAFTLTDQAGQAFDLERLRGKWSFLFFGYTHCPDICPITLGVLKSVADRLASEGRYAADSQMVFVSVDPARDTPEVLREYVGFFGPGFVGATGTDAQLTTFTRDLGVLYMRVGEGDGAVAGTNYLVDHSAAVLLVDPQGRLVGVFPAPQTVDGVAQRYAAIRAFLEAQS